MGILDIFFPKRCVGCGRVGKYFCSRCVLRIQTIKTNEAICPVCQRRAFGGATHPGCKTTYSLDGLTSFFEYEGVIKKAIKQLKYRLVSDMAAEFISLIPSSELTILRTNDASLIPIPLHPRRVRERGFNQAGVLGGLVAARLHIPMRTDILYRTKHTGPQAEIQNKEDRLKNMQRVFSVHNSKNIIRASRILLFDDVATTGATLRSAAQALKRAGTVSVWAITLAR